MTKKEILNTIEEYITGNGLQEITGTIMNTILSAMANIIPDDSMLVSSFGGIINPSSSITVVPGAPKWFWADKGTYSSAGGITVGDYGILSFDGSIWKNLEIELPKSENKIDNWSSGSYPASKQVFYEGNIYESIENVLTSDIPGISSKWINKTNGSEKWQKIKRTSSAININYLTGSNVKLEGLIAGDSIYINNLPTIGSVCIYVETTITINSINIPGVIWQNGVFPALDAGKGYYILISTFTGGTVKLGSVAGSWPLIFFKAQDTFEITGIPTADEKNNVYLKSNGDVFTKSSGYLTLQTKASNYPLLYVDLGTSNFTAVTKCDGSGTQADLIANVRFITNGFTFYFMTVQQNKSCIFGYVLDGDYQSNYGIALSVPNVDLNNYEMSIKRTGKLLEFFLDGIKLGEMNDGNAGTNQFMNYGIMLPNTSVKVKEIYAL